MKLKYLFLIIVLFGINQIGKSISSSVNYAIYQDISTGKSYIEIYSNIIGSSVVFVKSEDGKSYQSKIQNTIIIKQGEKIIDFKKYNLASPLTNTKIDFTDLTRMYIPAGNYQLEIEMVDLNDINNKFSTSKNIHVSPSKVSSLRLLSSVKKSEKQLVTVKNGINMEDLAYRRYFDKQNTLISYFELYPSESEGFSYVQYSIEQGGKTILKKTKRFKNQKVIPCLVNFNIEELISDEYVFNVKLVDKKENILDQKNIDFTKSNQKADLEHKMGENNLYKSSFVQNMSAKELNYNLKALIPIATSLERSVLSNAIDSDDKQIKKYALFEYWQRNSNGVHIENNFNSYMLVAKAIDKKYYSGFGYGFESDRGHIFLKYGKPTNTISVNNEPSAPPYEMWVYAYIEETHENNVRFVFYSPSLSDDHLLLHSTCKDELSNNRWEHELYKNAPKNDLEGNSIDGGSVKDNWNRKAKYYFNNL